jgi:hypothetical protein
MLRRIVIRVGLFFVGIVLMSIAAFTFGIAVGVSWVVVQSAFVFLFFRRSVQSLGGPLLPIKARFLPAPQRRIGASHYDRELEAAGFRNAGVFQAANAFGIRYRLFRDPNEAAYVLLAKSTFSPVLPEIIQFQGDDHLLRIQFGDRPSAMPSQMPNTHVINVESESIAALLAAYRQHAVATPSHHHTPEQFVADFERLWEQSMRWHYAEGLGRNTDPNFEYLKCFPKPDPETLAYVQEAQARKALSENPKP